MNRWLAVGLVLAAMVPVARADEASKQAKVHELFQTMHMERTMQQMMDQMTTFMQQQFQQAIQELPGADTLTPAQKKLTDDYMGRTMKLATDEMGWKTMEPEYTKIYASTYTEEEIDGILTFYKSPAGQAMLNKTPQLSAASMQIVQTKVGQLQPKVKAMQEEYMEQMKAAGTAKK
jgi:hypothetical protein